MTTPSAPSPADSNLLDYLYVVSKWRRFIVLCVLVVALAAAAVSMALPLSWTASTTLLPPEEERQGFGLAALIGAAVPAGLSGLVGGGAPPGEHLTTLLESRRLLGAAVDRFDLVAAYGAPHRQQAIETLDDRIEKEIGQNGAIVLKVTADEPEKAAAMANFLAAELDRLNRQIKRQQAANLRTFLDKRMAQIRTELEASGRQLQAFQKGTGLVDLEAQTQAVVEVAKGLAQELALLEAKLEVLRAQFGPQQPERRLLELEAGGLRRRLDEVLGGQSYLGPGLGQLPDLGFEYARRVLDVKLREEILRFLETRLEEAKYREALDTPTIQVLDAAEPPKVRSAPRRTLIVLIAASASLLLSVVLAFVFEGFNDIGRRHADKVEALKGAWRRRPKA